MNLSELDIKQTVHFTLGRFNPPTLGHKKLLDMVAGQGTDYFIFPTKTHDSKKNWHWICWRWIYYKIPHTISDRGKRL